MDTDKVVARAAEWTAARGDIEYLGEPLRFTSILAAAYGADSEAMKIYAVSSGVQAVLHEIDRETGVCTRETELPGASHVWALTRTADGDIYAGSTEGHLFRWRPEEPPGDGRAVGNGQAGGGAALIDFGQVLAGERYIWQIESDGAGMLYGCTYPNGKIFRFDERMHEIAEIFALPAHLQYARDIAMDGKEAIYCGGGTSRAEIYRIALPSGRAQQIPLPEGCQREATPYTLTVAGEYLYVVFDPSRRMFAYHRPSGVWTHVADEAAHSKAVPAPDGGIYFFGNNRLMHFEPHTGTCRAIAETTREYPANRSAMINERQIVNINRYGELQTIDVITGDSGVRRIPLRGRPIRIRSMCTDKAERTVYLGGYLFGGFARLDTVTGRMEAWEGVRQPESLCMTNDTIYFGLYPRAGLARYDPAQPWDPRLNPLELFDLIELKQDRPFAMCECEGKLLIGTVAYYGERQGMLTLFDPVAGVRESFAPVEEHSVVALAVRDGFVYGGTTIWGGLGAEPAPGDGHLFIWDLRRKRTVWQGAPIPGEPAVSDLQFDEQGRLWGICRDRLFLFDTVKKEATDIVSLAEPGAKRREGHYWKDNFIKPIAPGRFVAVSEGNLLAIDVGPDGEQRKPRAELLDTAVEQCVTVGGHFVYYTKKSRLYKLKLTE